MQASNMGQGLQDCLDFRSPDKAWQDVAQPGRNHHSALPSSSSAPGRLPDDILGKGPQPTAPVSCCLKEVVACGEAQPELKAERNNNTSVFQARLHTVFAGV